MEIVEVAEAEQENMEELIYLLQDLLLKILIQELVLVMLED
jgi:hypothetical protein